MYLHNYDNNNRRISTELQNKKKVFKAVNEILRTFEKVPVVFSFELKLIKE